MSKVALITGATAGIGEATAVALATSGYNLILTGRRAERLETLKERIEQDHAVHVHTLVFDVQNSDEVSNAIESLTDEWRRIDVLINNAGLALGLGPIQDGSLDDWETMIDTNVKGLLYMTKEVVPLMQKGSHIVNLSSIAGKEVYPNGNVYCATKHAVDALNKGMRIDLVQKGIRVTGIYPGKVETEFSIARFHGDKQRADAEYEGYDPLVAEDIADAIVYAISRPAHVNINEMIIMPTAQANGTILHKE